MNDASKGDPKHFAESMKTEMDSSPASVIQAVNNVPDGEWVAASEEQVRDFFVEFRKCIFDRAVQQRIDVVGQQGSPVGSRADGQPTHRIEVVVTFVECG